MTGPYALGNFFTNEDGKLPSFVDKIEDFPHMRILRLKGKLVTSIIPEMTAFFEKPKRGQGELNKNLLIELRKVTEVDSAALAQLVRILATLKQKKYRLGFFNVPEKPRAMLEILKLDQVFLIFESETQAFKQVLLWSEEWE